MALSLKGTDFVIWGSGAPLRQFIFSRDLGALTVAVLRRWDSVDPIILSVGEDAEVSIGQVARCIAGDLYSLFYIFFQSTSVFYMHFIFFQKKWDLPEMLFLMRPKVMVNSRKRQIIGAF